MNAAKPDSRRSDVRESIERFRQLPRLVQWGFLIVVGIVLFLIWDQYIAPVTREWNERASRIESQLQMVRDADRLNSDVLKLRETIIGIGEVELPRNVDIAKRQVEEAVNEVTGRFSISNHSFSYRESGTVGRGALAGLPGGQNVEKITGDLRFEASPEDAVAVIAALESRSEIERLVSLQMLKLPNRRVSVRLSLEAWGVPNTAAARGSV